jgi:DNA-binding NtrC family response regulator
LENAIFRAVVLAESDTIGPDEFPQVAAQLSTIPPTVAAPGIADPEADAQEPPIEAAHLALEGAGAAPLCIPSCTPALDLLDGNGEVRALEDIEADAIRFAINHYRGQMSQVARRLRIGRSTLYRKLDALGMEAAGR